MPGNKSIVLEERNESGRKSVVREQKRMVPLIYVATTESILGNDEFMVKKTELQTERAL